MQNLNIYTLLEKTPNKVNEEIIKHMYDSGKSSDYSDKEFIVREGSASDCIFIILDGKANVVKKDPFGNLVIIASLEKGSIIGEMGILLDLKRTASIQAEGKVKVLSVPNKSFLDALLRFPLLNIRLLKSLAGRIQSLNEKFMEAVSARNLMLIGMHILDGTENSGKSDSIEVSLNIHNISKQTNVELTRVTAVLSTYEDLKIIRNLHVTHGEAQCMIDLNQLREYLKKMS